MNATDGRALLAAANNADLYGLVFKAHGLGYRRDATAFVSRDDPPPYYGNMLTLDPHASASQLRDALALRLERGAVGVKDGFHCLDLGAEGFDLLFEATWIWASGERRLGCEGWERVRDADALAAWEDAWQASGSPAEQRVFPPNLLSEPRITFLGRPGKGGYDAGCIVNWSERCIGLSNVFGAPADKEVYVEASAVAAMVGDGRKVVSYDSGDALDVLIGCGFEAVGDLRVWVAGP